MFYAWFWFLELLRVSHNFSAFTSNSMTTITKALDDLYTAYPNDPMSLRYLGR